jgi:hypothetical protein
LRNIFDQYSQPENRVTHALMTALQEDRKLLGLFLSELVGVKPPCGPHKLAVLEQQYPGEEEPSEEELESRDVINGVPAEISTSYVERSNLSIRMGCRRFTRLTNGFSKRLENHCAAVSLYVAHYNLCRVHESLRSTPGMALGIADRVWTIGDLLDAALATQPITPETTAPDRRKRFRVIEGGRG